MKKKIIIPPALFAAVFCVSFFCQRYTLIFRENTGLFLLTPDWLREVFTRPLPLSNFIGSFLGQFYAERIAGPMIPAFVITVIYLCLCVFLRKCRVPFSRLIAILLALTAWCLTANISSTAGISLILLVSAALALVAAVLPRGARGAQPEDRKGSRQAGNGAAGSGTTGSCTIGSGAAFWIETAAACVLIACAAVFVGERKLTKENEAMAKVVVNADKCNWNEVLKVATPEKVLERPLMMPYALLALNSQVKLSESMFHYPVSGPECLELGKEKNAMGNLFQSYLFENLNVPNEAIHQMFQFGTNFDHGMTHLTLRRLIRLNIADGHYGMAVKYAEILSHNLYYRSQACRIISKYGGREDLTDSLEVHSSVAPALTQDPAYDVMQLFKGGNTSPVVIDRILAYLLLERNLDDFLTLFYSYDWHGKTIPAHYQEALLLKGDIRDGVTINPDLQRRYPAFMQALTSMGLASIGLSAADLSAVDLSAVNPAVVGLSTADPEAAQALSKGTYWEYYYSKAGSEDDAADPAAE